MSSPLPPAAPHIPATCIHIPEIPADSQEIGVYTADIAADIAEIGTYMKEIAGYRPETRISFMDTTPNWSEIAIYRPRNAAAIVETIANGGVSAATMVNSTCNEDPLGSPLFSVEWMVGAGGFGGGHPGGMRELSRG